MNGTDEKISEIDIYRGMKIGQIQKGQSIYTSAHDIGNIAAGYVAGANGMSWEASRMAFDTYQSCQSMCQKGTVQIVGEGISTRNAEWYGWKMGYNTTPFAKLKNFMRSIKAW